MWTSPSKDGAAQGERTVRIVEGQRQKNFGVLGNKSIDYTR